METARGQGFVDIAGQRFGRLIALQPVGRDDNATHHCILWLCRCDCGQETISRGTRLRAGAVKSCGCLRGQDPKRRLHKLAQKYAYQLADFDRVVRKWLNSISAKNARA